MRLLRSSAAQPQQRGAAAPATAQLLSRSSAAQPQQHRRRRSSSAAAARLLSSAAATSRQLLTREKSWFYVYPLQSRVNYTCFVLCLHLVRTCIVLYLCLCRAVFVLCFRAYDRRIAFVLVLYLCAGGGATANMCDSGYLQMFTTYKNRAPVQAWPRCRNAAPPPQCNLAAAATRSAALQPPTGGIGVRPLPQKTRGA